MSSATKKFGILTSGGDCPGLNAAIRGVVKPAFGLYGMNVWGSRGGFRGMITGDGHWLESEEVSGILTRGGTILGTSREKPFKSEKDSKEGLHKPDLIVENYKKLGLDALVVLGGNGTVKTANLLSEAGLNVVALPKTIDNDLWGTDMTFGFHSALDVATEGIDRLHSTADSHNRVMVVEIMGHKAGWLTLYSGLAGGGDVILIPEIPYNINSVIEHLGKRSSEGKNFSIVAVAEGAVSTEEAKLGKKEIRKKRASEGYPSISYRLAQEIEAHSDAEARVTVLGYLQRGGKPSAYDRILSTRFGTAALDLLQKGEYGKMVALEDDKVVAKDLSKVAGKLKLVPTDHDHIRTARMIGTCFGD
ncbi:ATP-dependent 6-phosphofructokinase [Spirochaeta cellobiosiphila]|uniref:6-phosphofructokinase n=1 Tax=Spirochaeta cellobiosiphila TaxID=504483 RepID=UPI00040A8BDD